MLLAVSSRIMGLELSVRRVIKVGSKLPAPDLRKRVRRALAHALPGDGERFSLPMNRPFRSAIVSSSTSRSMCGSATLLRLVPPRPHTAALRFRGSTREIPARAILSPGARGESFSVARKVESQCPPDALSQKLNRANVTPSPGGEGRGEGGRSPFQPRHFAF